MGAKSTTVFIFLLYSSIFLYIFFVLIDLICWFFFILGRDLFLCGLYRKLNFSYSENVVLSPFYMMSFILTQKTKLNCN